MKKVLLSLLLLSPIPLLCQTIESNFLKQLTFFPQEKVYIHTDKSAYISGEKIWYRIYLVNAKSHAPEELKSRYVYVDLTDPLGRIVRHDMIRADEEGYYHNNITLDGDLPQGYYILRGYTRYMLNRPDYLFEKKVFVSDPQSFVATAQVAFSKGRSRQASAKLTFTDKDGKPIEVSRYMAGLDTTENLTTYTKGKEVSFRVTPDQKQTLYVVFEYKDRMHRSYFSIPDLDEAFDVTFHPEGGTLLADVENVVGFKSINTNGLAEPVVVELLEKGGELITKVTSNALGMGTFTFNAEFGKSYVAKCTNNKGVSKLINLEDARSDITSIQAVWQEEKLHITARQGKQTPQSDESLTLLMHVRGNVVYSDQIAPNATLTIDKASIPSGVIHILLLDNAMNPLSERLVFCNNNDLATVTMLTNQNNYAKRDLVQVEVSVTDITGAPVLGSYSVSVTDNSDIQPEVDFTIGSVLLLSSDLRGYIDSPGYYFEPAVDRSNELDALLLTQGWRRYNIPAIAKGEIETPDQPAELWQEIVGLVRQSKSGKVIENETVTLLTPDVGTSLTAVSDVRGRFSFEKIEFPDSTRYILQASNSQDADTELLFIHTTPLSPPQPFFSPSSLLRLSSGESLSSNLYYESLKKADTKYALENGMRTRNLSPLILSISNAKEMTVDEEVYITNSILSLLLRSVPGIDVVEQSGGVPIFFFPRSTSSFETRNSDVITDQFGRPAARIFVDNRIMDPYFDIRTIPLTSVATIEGMARPSSSMFGSEGVTGGAIMITTKYGTNSYETMERPNLNTKEVTPLGYKKEVEFYTPKYDTPERRSTTTPDLRTTLYWNPKQTLVNGKSTFDFYAADAETTYSIVLEGITNNGKLFRQVGIVERTGR